ncbi:MAG: ferritin [Chlorobi bacterium]|nr:ferritin [Chlorobiota bacterium]
MITEKMQDALNGQLNKELFSSYLYLAMAAYFEAESYAGMARWMNLQAQEEHEHALKFYDYLIKVNARVKLTAIDEPQFEWESPAAAFQAAYKHEQFITQSVNDLADLAMNERDHATAAFLRWFVDEQVEEEATVSEIVDNFKMIGDSKSALFMLDRELGQRTNAPDTTAN